MGPPMRAEPHERRDRAAYIIEGIGYEELLAISQEVLATSRQPAGHTL